MVSMRICYSRLGHSSQDLNDTQERIGHVGFSGIEKRGLDNSRRPKEDLVAEAYYKHVSRVAQALAQSYCNMTCQESFRWLLEQTESPNIPKLVILVTTGFMYVRTRRMLIVHNDEYINRLPTLYWWRIVIIGKRKKKLLHLE